MAEQKSPFDIAFSTFNTAVETLVAAYTVSPERSSLLAEIESAFGDDMIDAVLDLFEAREHDAECGCNEY